MTGPRDLFARFGGSDGAGTQPPANDRTPATGNGPWPGGQEPESQPPGDERAGTGRTRRAALIAVAAVVLVLVALVAYRWGSTGSAQPVAAPSPTPTPTRSPTTAEIYGAVAASVVTIEGLAADGRTVNDTGTGVIVNADATILTALHVVKGTASVRVIFADGTASPATISAVDPTRDIATLAPAERPEVLVPAVLGRSDRLAVGDAVVAIGNPLGLTRTTTTGVVSGLDRSANPEGQPLTGLIQFDAAVNPGSSGGPLINAKGETVGIVVALANPTAAGTFIGIGFAVPITAAVAGGGGRGPQQ